MTAEESFAARWQKNLDAMDALGVRTARLRKQMESHGVLPTARRILDGRTLSDGFGDLQRQGRLDLSLEALAISGKWGSLFTDEQANEAISRLMEAGYNFLSR